MELHVDFCGFSNPDRQDEHFKLRKLDGNTEATECDDISTGMINQIQVASLVQINLVHSQD